jgi:hypothetical protein
LDGLVGTPEQLIVVLACLRAQQPYLVATLSLRRCAALQGAHADVSAALLAEFLVEEFANAPPRTSVDQRLRDACLEVLYLGDNGLEAAMAEGSSKCPAALLVKAWLKKGCLHKPLAELPAPLKDASADGRSSSNVPDYPPLTLRRKSKAYWGGPGGPTGDAKRGAEPPLCSPAWRLARLAMIPERWRAFVDDKPKAKKSGGGGGSEKKKKK